MLFRFWQEPRSFVEIKTTLYASDTDRIGIAVELHVLVPVVVNQQGGRQRREPGHALLVLLDHADPLQKIGQIVAFLKIEL